VLGKTIYISCRAAFHYRVDVFAFPAEPSCVGQSAQDAVELPTRKPGLFHQLIAVVRLRIIGQEHR
jgi:hypothetical protein